MGPASPLLRVEDLTVRPGDAPAIVSGVGFSIDRGECLALVGESGSGKSMSAMAIAGLLPAVMRASGRVLLEGRDVLPLEPRERRELSGSRIGFVFQDAMSALHPLMRIREQLTRPLRLHKGLGKREAAERAAELLDQVGIRNPEDVLSGYIHQLSGGMRQRVMIAMAISCDPDLVIADEPTTALDAAVQGRILELLSDLRVSRDIAVLLISHDLAVVSKHSDRIAVMFRGRVMESGATREVIHDPQHAYTKALLNASPDRNRGARRLPTIRTYMSAEEVAAMEGEGQ